MKTLAAISIILACHALAWCQELITEPEAPVITAESAPADPPAISIKSSEVTEVVKTGDNSVTIGGQLSPATERWETREQVLTTVLIVHYDGQDVTCQQTKVIATATKKWRLLWVEE